MSAHFSAGSRRHLALSGAAWVGASGDLESHAACKARMAAKFPSCQLNDLPARAKLAAWP